MRVSACLIVKNEARFIDDCLKSLAGIVDEIILVDTGSTDDTIERAQRYPVKLFHFPWIGDFSAARNHALTQSTGDWNLYIDADERFRPHAPEWRDQLAEDFAGLKVRFHPRVDWTAYAELRLFRNHPEIRFEGVIHERITPSVEAICKVQNKTVGDSDIAIQHVGYEDDQSFKTSRNIPLLRTYLERDPTRIFCWWHLGDNLVLLGDRAGAIEAWRKGVEVVRARSPAFDDPSDRLVYLALVRALQEAGEPFDDLLAEARTRFPTFLGLDWVEALLRLERGETAMPRTVFERLASIDADQFFDPTVSYDKAMFGHQALEGLALCNFRDGRFAEAATHYRAAARTAPNVQELLAKAMLCEARAGRAQDGRSARPNNLTSERDR